MDVMVVRAVMSHPGVRPQAVIHGGTWRPPRILGVCVDPVPGIVMCATYQRGYGGSVSWLGGSDGGLGSKVRCHLRSSHGGLDIGKALNPCVLASTQFCSSPSRSISGSFSTLKLILLIPPISHGFLGHVKIHFHVSLGGTVCGDWRSFVQVLKTKLTPSSWCILDLAADGVGRALVLEEVVKVAADPTILGMRGINKGGVGGGQLLVGSLLMV
jgi:hypothetical protein